MSLYTELREEVAGILEDPDIDQGGIFLVRRITVTPASEWIEPTFTTVRTPLPGAAMRVNRRYVDGARVLYTDRQVIFSDTVITPLPTDQVEIDGAKHVIVSMIPSPGAGVKIVWTLVVRGS